MADYPFLKTYRTFNKWADQAIIIDATKGAVPFELAGLDEYLDDPWLSGLKYRFFATPGNHEYQKLYRQIPLKNIIDYAQVLMEPVYGDYTEVTENKEFLRICNKFYFEWFVQELLFVSYNVFQGDNAIAIQPSQEKNKRIIEKLKKRGGFDLWVKLDEDMFSENNDFMHIETGIMVRFPKWEDDLAWIRWGAQSKKNLTNWINVAGIELSLTQYFTQCIRMCGKKLILTTQGQNDTQVEKLNEMLNSFNNFLHFNLKNQSDLEPLVAFDGDDLMSIKDCVYYYLDRLKFEFGRVANTNPKGERITSGENYKDITAIANRQKINLENLNDFTEQVAEKFGVELEFAVSGIPEKEAVYSIAHGAQTPNMVKEMFGQVEGTNPRPPKGEPGLRRNMNSVKTKKKANGSTQWSH